jgi:hypothetical protein
MNSSSMPEPSHELVLDRKILELFKQLAELDITSISYSENSCSIGTGTRINVGNITAIGNEVVAIGFLMLLREAGRDFDLSAALEWLGQHGIGPFEKAPVFIINQAAQLFPLDPPF